MWYIYIDIFYTHLSIEEYIYVYIRICIHTYTQRNLFIHKKLNIGVCDNMDESRKYYAK